MSAEAVTVEGIVGDGLEVGSNGDAMVSSSIPVGSDVIETPAVG